MWAVAQPLTYATCSAGAQVARDAFGSALSTERLTIGSNTWALAREGLRGAPCWAALRSQGYSTADVSNNHSVHALSPITSPPAFCRYGF